MLPSARARFEAGTLISDDDVGVGDDDGGVGAGVVLGVKKLVSERCGIVLSRRGSRGANSQEFERREGGLVLRLDEIGSCLPPNF